MKYASMNFARLNSGIVGERSKVFLDGVDVTPKPLEDPFRALSVGGPKAILSEEQNTEESALLDNTHEDTTGKSKIEIVEDDLLQNTVKPGLETPKNLAKPIGEDAFKILLRETKTFHLLSIESIYKEKGKKCKRDQSKHAKKLIDTASHETQTIQSPMRDEATMTTPVIMKDSSTYVSNWDLYCSSMDGKPIPKPGKRSKFWSKFDRTVAPTLEEEVTKTIGLHKFKHACIITERLLASNNYSEQQAKFLKNCCSGKLEGKSSNFHYKMEELWAFNCEHTDHRTVTALSWNPLIEGTLAISYGSITFHSSLGGLVCLWSVLNPCQPEQLYEFEQSVNDVNFSKEQPELLAAACNDGSIWIINVTLSTKVAVESSRIRHLGPVWKLEWAMYNNLITEEETLISAGSDGRICQWDILNQFSCSLLLRIRYGPEKQIKPSVADDGVQGSHYLSGLTISIDPKYKNIYHVGTSQGFVVKCCMNDHHNFRDIFMAHEGPIYSTQFSPFCQSILLTSGGDWTMRLWIEDVPEPILIIRTAMEPVMRAVWSPVHSTIIVSISGNELALWDLSRKILYPMTVAYTSKDCTFTTVEFDQKGNNIIAGDNHGNAHVYNLQEMPYIPHHQKKFLIDSLKVYLKSKPKLHAELEKMEYTSKPFY